MSYGYTGGSQRVTAFDDRINARRVLCWGDAVTREEIAPFVAFGHFHDVRIEPVTDEANEVRSYPPYDGSA